MIVFCMYALKYRSDRGASGGHVSNLALILEVAKSSPCIVLAPNLSLDIQGALADAGVRWITQKFGETGLSARNKKRGWLSRVLSEQVAREPASSIFSANGTSGLVQKILEKVSPNSKHVIVSRAYEDLYRSPLNGGWKTRLKSMIFDLLELGGVARAYRESSVVITNSQYMKSVLEDYFKLESDKIEVLYPPVDVPKGKYSSGRALGRIGFVNPSVRKGEEILVELAQSNPSIEFFYFGSEDRGYSLNNLHYAGWKSDVEEIFKQIDLLIVPSRWKEPFGRVAIEAIAHGKPVLVSDRGGLPETVDPLFVVVDDRTEGWNASLRRLQSSPDECRDAWQRSFDDLRRFDSQAHAHRVTTILERLAHD